MPVDLAKAAAMSKAIQAAQKKGGGGKGGILGMVSEASHLVKGLPVGLFGLGKMAGRTAVGFGLNLAELPEDIVKPLGIGDGADRYDDWAAKQRAAGKPAGQWDYARRDIPLVTMLAESLGHTGHRIIHPSEYVKAYRQGGLVSAALEDVGNVALVGGLAAKGLGAGGVVAKNAGATSKAEALLNASGKLKDIATLGANAAGAPAKVWGLPVRAANKGLVAKGLPTVGESLNKGINKVAMNAGESKAAQVASRTVAPLTQDLRSARHSLREMMREQLLAAGTTEQTLNRLVGVSDDPAVLTAARLLDEGRMFHPDLTDAELASTISEHIGTDKGQIALDAVKMVRDYQAGRVAPEVVAKLEEARSIWRESEAVPRSDRYAAGLGRREAGNPDQLTGPGPASVRQIEAVKDEHLRNLEKAADKAGRQRAKWQESAIRANRRADAADTFARMMDRPGGLIRQAAKATSDEAKTLNLARRSVEKARRVLDDAIKKYDEAEAKGPAALAEATTRLDDAVAAAKMATKARDDLVFAARGKAKLGEAEGAAKIDEINRVADAELDDLRTKQLDLEVEQDLAESGQGERSIEAITADREKIARKLVRAERKLIDRPTQQVNEAVQLGGAIGSAREVARGAADEQSAAIRQTARLSEAPEPARVGVLRERAGTARQAYDQTTETAARQSGLAREIRRQTVADLRSRGWAREQAIYSAGKFRGRAATTNRAFGVAERHAANIEAQIEAILSGKDSPLLRTPQESLRMTRESALASFDSVVGELPKAAQNDLRRRLNAAYSTVKPTAHLEAFDVLKRWNNEFGTGDSAGGWKGGLSQDSTIPGSVRHGGFTAEQWNKIERAFDRQRRAERKMLEHEYDMQMQAAPAAYRRVAMGGKRQMKALLDDADKAWEAGDRQTAIRQRELAEDVVASVRDIAAKGGPEPQHYIGGVRHPTESRGAAIQKGNPMGTKKLHSEFESRTSTFDPDPYHYLGSSLKDWQQAIQNENGRKVRAALGRSTDELTKLFDLPSLMDLSDGAGGTLDGASRSRLTAAALEERGWVATPIKWDGSFTPSGIRSSKSGLVPPNAESISNQTVWMPRHIWQYLNKEMTRKQGALLQGVSAVNSVWKQTVLPLSARWHIGNVVGNTINSVVLGGINPWEVPKFLREGRKLIRNGELPMQTFESTMAKEFTGQLGLSINADKPARFGKLGAGTRAVINKSYAANNFVDSSFRAAVFAAKKAEGMSDETATKMALEAMGDFQAMTPFERQVMREVFPFYAWTRHITKSAFRLPATNPVRAAWVMHLSDMSGDDEGKFPEWMGPVAKVPGLGNVSVSFLNPVGEFGANPVIDPTAALRAVSPAIKVPVAAFTGRNLARGLDPLTRPAGSIRYDADGNKVLNQRPSPRELLGFTLRQVPMARNALDVITGGGSARYDTGQQIEKNGNPLGATGRLVSAAKMFGIPTGMSDESVEAFRKERESRLKSIAKAKARRERSK